MTAVAAIVNKPTSAEELRRKRLAALTGDTSTSETSVSAASPPVITAEVVDLCDSSDDERKPAARRSFVQYYNAPPPYGYFDSENEGFHTTWKQANQRKRKGNVENERPTKKQTSTEAKSSHTGSTKSQAAGSYKKATTTSTGSKKAEGIKNVTSNKAARSKNVTSSQKSQSILSSNNASTSFQVATWNVWFGAQNLDAGEPHASARMKALARHLLRAHDAPLNPLLAIGFQEVIDELVIHLFPLLESAGYQIFRQPGAPYGCALAIYTSGSNSATLLDASWQPYTETYMSRGFLYARFQLASQEQLLFCTTHLESWIGKENTGARQRVRQLQELEAFCNHQLQTYSSLQAAIITGDMNWDDERRSGNTDSPMASVFQTSWIDSWLDTKSGKETCYTYDGKVNPMLGGNLRRRFDRCLVRNTEAGSVESIATQLVGTEALPGLTWQKYNPYKQIYKEMPTAPSDHFGLVVQMAINK